MSARVPFPVPLLSRVIQFGRLLALVLWVGGICFFAFAVAPVAFGRLPSAREAGLVVGGTLRVLDLLGLCCGVLFTALTAVATRRWMSRRALWAEYGLVAAMLFLTAALHFGVLPAMERDRAAAGGDVAVAAPDDAGRIDFERLHRRSERMEGAVLVGGLLLLLAVAGEMTHGIPAGE